MFTRQPAGNNMRISLWNHSPVHGQIITIIAYYFVERLVQQLLNYSRLHRESSIAGGCLAVISGRARGLFRCAAVVIAVSNPPPKPGITYNNDYDTSTFYRRFHF